MPVIDLIYIDSGGGHRAAAQAIEAVAREQQRPWEIRLEGAQQLFDSIDFVRKISGIPFEEIYNIILRRGWTVAAAPLIPISHLLIRMSHRSQIRILEEHWREHPADMVVSVIPHYNRSLRQAFAQACPGRPFVTIMTDIADYPPHFWIEVQDQYLFCGSARARQQAIALGLPEDRVLQMSGMILDPRFHAPPPVDRAAARIRLGLQPDLPTGLVLFGGQGSHDSVRVARALNRPGSAVQLIVLCGRREESLRELRAMDRHIPMHIEGFTREIPHYMQLADFFIGKPGPGSISESLAMALPVIVERNFRTLAHERFNADWIVEQELGLVVKSFDHISEAVAELLQPDRYRRLKSNAAKLHNSAVYEAVDWIGSILSHHANGEADLPWTNVNPRLTPV